MEHKNETLEQRRRAQREFLELKKMQQGVVTPEPTSTENAVPLTFKEKIENFWFHYKVHTFFVIFICIILVIGISQCATKEKYDARVVFYTDKVYADEQIAFLKDYITPCFSDIDGDGTVNIQLINCSYGTEGSFDMNYANSVATKLQAIIANEGDVQLFIVDPARLTQLNSISDTLPSFFTETVPFPEEIYNKATENSVTLPEGLIMGRRIVEGTLIENIKDIDKYISDAKSAMEKFKG